MSDKKKKTADVFHNPFKPLKGLPVSGNPPAGKPDPDDSPSPIQTTCSQEDHHLFEDEMGAWGVKRLERGDVAAEEDLVEPSAAPIEPDAGKIDDDLLFQLAMDGVDPAFKDEWTEEEAASPAPRRRRQVRLGRLKPEAQLDLHGMRRDEALAKVRFFLENAHHRGFKTVLIITGKGDRSNDGPVLRHAVIELLKQGQDGVLEWMEAPRRYGGSGALVVCLR